MSKPSQAVQSPSKRRISNTLSDKVSHDIGPLSLLPGRWENTDAFQGHGWNMIALPFPKGEHGYRLLNNQYNESLTFNLVDKDVPNRGINGDQEIVTLDYVQSITQIAAEDFPKSGLAGNEGLAIHHEPGLWLHMKNQTTEGLDIARLSSIPHGDSVMALGKSEQLKSVEIPSISGLPIGVTQNLQNNPYLSPYLHFQQHPFKNLFDPTNPNALLKDAIMPFFQAGKVANVTQLNVSTKNGTGGIDNIPFVTKQADAVALNATFWIYELTEKHANGEPRLLLQYTQEVLLAFFERPDGKGLIEWPHVSINTLEKVPSHA